MSAKSTILEDNDFIVAQLLKLLGEKSYREISRDTGHHGETIRRYFSKESGVKASFIRSACVAYGIDANLLLLGRQAPANEKDLRYLDTSAIISELAVRFARVEACLVGRALIGEIKAGRVPQGTTVTSHEALADR